MSIAVLCARLCFENKMIINNKCPPDEILTGIFMGLFTYTDVSVLQKTDLFLFFGFAAYFVAFFFSSCLSLRLVL